tara:strand:- start:102 stop:236 length:135 start_codon:yes stop_codon:yes gene_type:complete
VSNTWVIYPKVWNNLWKQKLIPDETTEYFFVGKGGDLSGPVAIG